MTCGVCGSTFSDKPSRARVRRFCSLACKAAAERTDPGDRLEGKYVVDESTGCWNWVGKLRADGYGIICSSKVGSRRPRELRAHRVSFERHIGSIPEGLDLDHLCRNRRCVNPEHLEPVTRKENLRRGASEHSGGKTHCKHDHEFTPTNTYVTSAGYRNCRTCRRDYYMRKKRSRASAPEQLAAQPAPAE